MIMEQALDFKSLFYMLRKKFYWVIIALFLGVLAGFFISEYLMTDMFVSSTQIYISNSQETQIIDKVSGSDITASRSMANTYCIILQSQRSTDLLKAKLQENELYLNTSSKLRNYTVTISVQSNTEVLKISAKAGDPMIAALVCNTVVEVASELISEIFESGRANSLGDASVNYTPASPNTRLNIIIGAVVGILIAGGLIVLSFLADNRVKDESDFVRKVGIPVLGEVPSMHVEENGKEDYYYYANYKKQNG
ncbi:MAG: hypothetical protein IKU61_06800 [Clostridia bacterium]|nr:hypothetical protein [Clostridia bacterium]